MIESSVLLPLFYVAFQWTMIKRLSGRWRTAAMLPAPVLGFLMVLVVFASVLGMAEAPILLVIGLPLMTLYLLALAMAFLTIGKAARSI